MLEKALNFVVENNFDCIVYFGDDNSYCTSGKLYKHLDTRNVPIYTINHDRWIMRVSEILSLDITNNYVGIYLAF